MYRYVLIDMTGESQFANCYVLIHGCYSRKDANYKYKNLICIMQSVSFPWKIANLVSDLLRVLDSKY